MKKGTYSEGFSQWLNKKAAEALKKQSPVSFTQLKRTLDLSRGLAQPTDEETMLSRDALRKSGEKLDEERKNYSSSLISKNPELK